MPELPEVETIKRELNKEIIGKTIVDVEILYPKAINLPPEEFRKRIKGKKIEEIKRRAKVLLLKLSNNLNLVIHLKLSGQLIFRKQKTKEKYTSLIIYFSDKSLLYFNDVRKFGYVKLFDSQELTSFWQKMGFGLEPLSKEFTLEKFRQILKERSKSKIKPLLMDQSVIAGIGNVYSQESCFCAKILPYRLAGSLTNQESNNLYNCLIKILRAAIDKKGSSVDDYLDIYGEEGKYLPFLKVYRREGEKCYRCGAKIKKIVLAGRGTYFCPNCQK